MLTDLLMKLHKMAFALKNSTTLLLSHWHNTMAVHHLPHCMMLCDVSTWWNSRFGMLSFALCYCPAINTMTMTWEFNLCQYELVPTDWKITGELHDVLQVIFFSFSQVFQAAHDSLTDF